MSTYTCYTCKAATPAPMLGDLIDGHLNLCEACAVSWWTEVDAETVTFMAQHGQ